MSGNKDRLGQSSNNLPPVSVIVEATPLPLPLVRAARHIWLPVLLVGETGVGKTYEARRIHEAGPHRKGPFVAVNCAELPRDLLEAELFGAERGAYTGAVARPGKFEQAEGGTLFLDEIGELPLELQAKLLQAVELKPMTRLGGTKAKVLKVRLIFATNRDLPNEVEAGRFRSDLFYRISGYTVAIKPLRERRGEINGLVNHLCEELRGKIGSVGISRRARQLLRHQTWRGNIRELRHVLQRAALLAGEGGDQQGRHISEKSLHAALAEHTLTRPALPTLPRAVSADTMVTAETIPINSSTQAGTAMPTLAVHDTKWAMYCQLRGQGLSAERIAASLGWSRRTLYRRLAEWGWPRLRQLTTQSVAGVMADPRTVPASRTSSVPALPPNPAGTLPPAISWTLYSSLAQAGQTAGRIAAALGLTRATFYRRLNNLGWPRLRQMRESFLAAASG